MSAQIGGLARATQRVTKSAQKVAEELKAAKEAAKEVSKIEEALKSQQAPAVLTSKRAKPGQTVSSPERMAFPGIYKRRM